MPRWSVTALPCWITTFTEFDQFDSLNGSENVDDAKLDADAGVQFDEEDFEDTFITTKKTPGLQANLRL